MKKSLILLLLLLVNSLWLKGQSHPLRSQGTYTNPQFFKDNSISITVAKTNSCAITPVFIAFDLKKQHSADDKLQLFVEFPPNNLLDLSNYSITASDVFNFRPIPVTSIVDGNKIIVTLEHFVVYDLSATYEINLNLKNYALGFQTAIVTARENDTEVFTYTDPNGGTVVANDYCLVANEDDYGMVTPGTTTNKSIFANDVSIYGTWDHPVLGLITYRPNGIYGPGDAASKNPNNTTASIIDDGGLSGVTLNTDGTLNIPANARPDNYMITYQICSSEDNTIPCKQANIKLIIPGVEAINDPNFATFNQGTGGISTTSVLANDKYTDGTTPTSANVTVSAYNTPWPAGITIDADGKITVTSTAAAGTYNLEYQICNKNNTADCAMATVTVQVNGLTANHDNGTATAGGASTPVANVVANDQYNGATPVIGTANGQVTISQSGNWPAGITLNTTTGAVSVAATVAAGTYSMDYQICVNGVNPVLCKIATITITLESAVCYEDPNTTTTGTPVNHGITLLKRAGTENGNWPMIRSSAHTALESNTKGFVITRMSTAQINNIAIPVEGMMVYDTDDKCLKIYVVDNTTPANSGWKCFSTPACP